MKCNISLVWLACPYKLINVSNFSSGKYSLYTRDKGPINPTALFEGGFFSKLKSGCGDSPQTSSLDFIMGFSDVFQLKKQRIRPIRLTGNAYLVI